MVANGFGVRRAFSAILAALIAGVLAAPAAPAAAAVAGARPDVGLAADANRPLVLVQTREPMRMAQRDDRRGQHRRGLRSEGRGERAARQAARERRAQQRSARERRARQQARQARERDERAARRAARERRARQQAAQERRARQQARQARQRDERAARQAARERRARQQAAQERRARQQAAQERRALEQARQARQRDERAARRAARERRARQQAGQERRAGQQAAQERRARQQARQARQRDERAARQATRERRAREGTRARGADPGRVRAGDRQRRAREPVQRAYRPGTRAGDGRERRLDALRAERRRDRREAARRTERRAERRRADRREAYRADPRRAERLRARRAEVRRALGRADRRIARRDARAERLARQRAWERRRLDRLGPRGPRLDRGPAWFAGAPVVWRGPDRRIVRHGAAGLFVLGSDLDRFRYGASSVRVVPIGEGWTEHVVIRPDGVRVVTVRDASGFVVRRVKILPGGRRIVLFDNRPVWWDERDVVVSVAPPRVTLPPERYVVSPATAPAAVIADALLAPPVAPLDRPYTLNQILTSAALRAYMPRIDLDTITFATDSAEIRFDQIDRLETVGLAMEAAIAENPDEVYLIEGHTDRVGDAVYNLALSDRRAEAVAAVLTEYFDIPPENLVVQGYGEAYPKVDTPGPSAANRRVAIRRITPLLGPAAPAVAAAAEGPVLEAVVP